MVVKDTGDFKLGELILLIAQRSVGDLKFGKVKLNKILFKIDFTAFLKLGHSVTGQHYFKLREGPGPKRMLPVLSAMEKRGDIKFERVSDYGSGQQKAVANRDPKLTHFSADELVLIDEVLADYKDKSGTTLSRESHDLDGWLVSEDKEVIPYTVALVGKRKPSQSETEYGLSLESYALECLGATH